MKYLLYVVTLILAVPASATDPLRVLASVERIHEEGAPLRPGVYIDFVVHAPKEFRGLPITMFATGASRRARRAEFPIGAMFALQLPDTAAEELKRAKLSQSDIESEIDNGVKPEMISNFVAPAQIDLAALPIKPTPVDLR